MSVFIYATPCIETATPAAGLAVSLSVDIEWRVLPLPTSKEEPGKAYQSTRPKLSKVRSSFIVPQNPRPKDDPQVLHISEPGRAPRHDKISP